MVFTKLLLENALAIRPCNCEAASEPLFPKVARCIPVLPSRYTGKCAARVLKRSAQTNPRLRQNKILRIDWTGQMLALNNPKLMRNHVTKIFPKNKLYKDGADQDYIPKIE